VGHVVHIREMRNAYEILLEREDLGIDEKIILEWILGKQGGKVWTGNKD